MRLEKLRQLYKEATENSNRLREEAADLIARHYKLVGLYRDIGEELRKVLSLEEPNGV